jgi:hypothetical protein
MVAAGGRPELDLEQPPSNTGSSAKRMTAELGARAEPANERAAMGLLIGVPPRG